MKGNGSIDDWLETGVALLTKPQPEKASKDGGGEDEGD